MQTGTSYGSVGSYTTPKLWVQWNGNCLRSILNPTKGGDIYGQPNRSTPPVENGGAEVPRGVEEVQGGRQQNRPWEDQSHPVADHPPGTGGETVKFYKC